jgi:hypothetical protein
MDVLFLFLMNFLSRTHVIRFRIINFHQFQQTPNANKPIDKKEIIDIKVVKRPFFQLFFFKKYDKKG